MELWQMDVMGGMLLEDGTECKVITGIDDHSQGPQRGVQCIL